MNTYRNIILEYLETQREPVSIYELAIRIGIPQKSVRGVLYSNYLKHCIRSKKINKIVHFWLDYKDCPLTEK